MTGLARLLMLSTRLLRWCAHRTPHFIAMWIDDATRSPSRGAQQPFDGGQGAETLNSCRARDRRLCRIAGRGAGADQEAAEGAGGMKYQRAEADRLLGSGVAVRHCNDPLQHGEGA